MLQMELFNAKVKFSEEILQDKTSLGPSRFSISHYFYLQIIFLFLKKIKSFSFFLLYLLSVYLSSQFNFSLAPNFRISKTFISFKINMPKVGFNLVKYTNKYLYASNFF